MSKAIDLVNYDELGLISKTLDNVGESFAQLYSIILQPETVRSIETLWDVQPKTWIYSMANSSAQPNIWL